MRGIVKQVTKAVGLYEPLVRARDRKRPWHEGLSPEHLEEMQAFYARFVSRGSLVFDIGANVGNRTGVFRQLGARVIAVEPQPHCLNRLRGSFGHDPEVTLEAVALGPELGQATMHVGDVSTVSSLSEDWVDAMRKSGVMGTAWSKTITVPLVRFDTLIERHGEPDFCKIDVEGFEPQVLSGLSRPVRCMSLEYQTQFHVSLGQCLERLRSLGEYRFQFSEGESMRLGFEDWMDEQELTARIETMRDAGGPEFFGDVYARFAD